MDVTCSRLPVLADIRSSWRTSPRSKTAWVYLVLFLAAEIFAAGVDSRIAITLDALILLALIHHGARTEDEAERAFLWTLALVPIIRILALSLPLARIPVLYWYGIISVPILAAVTITAHTLGYSPRDLGLSLRHIDPRVALLMFLSGLTLGAVDYLILRPQPMFSGLTIQRGLLFASVLVVLAAFVDEIVFRGLMQRAALRSIESHALVYMAALYAVMNVGYLSAFQIVFVFLVGLLFAYVSTSTKSIMEVTLAHGSLNVSLLLIAPLLPPFARYTIILPLALLTASASAASAVLLTRSSSASLALNELTAVFLQPWHSSRRVSWAELFSRLIDFYNGAIVSIPVAGRLVTEWVIHLPRYTLAILRSAHGQWERSWSVKLASAFTGLRLGMQDALEGLGDQLRRWVAARVRWLKREWLVFSARSWTTQENQSWDEYLIAEDQSRVLSQSDETSSSTSLALWSRSNSAMSEAELIERGLALLDAKNEREAYRYFSRAVEINPTNVRAWFWKAKTARTLDEIVRCLEQALELDPDNRMVAANLALFRQRRKQWRRQRDALRDDAEPEDCYA
jgi:membrane protease YdiL (CAAX protease family)/tetratricopeptide (TPR) repeat protein